ncbi:MAG: photosynthetic reaction center cytochrome c subunit [Gluconacetobacter diazotrophicus]|nr:photosynthetic reaction center cytochrome c subunit [Gluconacetobacter diazotrophicus]
MTAVLAPFLVVGYLVGAIADLIRRRPWFCLLGASAVVAAAAIVGLLFTLQRPPPVSIQLGYRGVAMQQTYNPRQVGAQQAIQLVDPVLPPVKPAGRKASEVYKNIKVLGDLDANEFLRLMGAMTQWIAPQAGCAFCHSLNNMASDAVYTKTIARRMLQMTWKINADWKVHVGSGGVTCQTCHRNEAIPTGSWFVQPPPHGSRGLTEAAVGQNLPAREAGLTALPYDPLTPFLLDAAPIRVIGRTALPNGDRSSINQTDWTYAFMIYFANSLGVNCTYCHNTRAFEEWDQSTPNRTVAWHGIRMTRELNHEYMLPLTDTFPRDMRGKLDDVPKIGCVSCHNGAYKPFYGASALSAYPELAAPVGGATVAAATEATPIPEAALIPSQPAAGSGRP